MDPMTMLMIGSTAIEFLGAQKQAKADEARYQQNRINAGQARDLKINSLNTRMLQEGEAASAQKEQLAIASLKKEATASVAAGESGVSGSSVDRTLAEFETMRLRGNTTINSNTEMLRNQIELEKIGASAEAQQRVDSMSRGQEPNFLAYAVQAGAQAYAGHLSAQAADPKNIAKQITDINAEVSALSATQSFGPRLVQPSISSYKVGFGLQASVSNSIARKF